MNFLLALAGILLVSAALLAFHLRPRPRKPRLEVLSDSAARVAFRDGALEEQRRRNG